MNLEYYKKKLIKILNNQNENQSTEFQKSLFNLMGDYIIEKGRAANIGEIREWKGKKYIKIAPNKWRPKYDTVSRGAKQSIAHVRRKIQNANTIEELAQILKENKDRFSDENGKPIEIAKEVLREAQKAKKEKTKIAKQEKESANQPLEKTSVKAKLEDGKIKKDGKTIEKNDEHYESAVKEAFVEEYKEDIQEYEEAKEAKEEKPESKTLAERFREAKEKLSDDMFEFSEKIGEKIDFIKNLFLKPIKKKLAENKRKKDARENAWNLIFKMRNKMMGEYVKTDVIDKKTSAEIRALDDALKLLQKKGYHY